MTEYRLHGPPGTGKTRTLATSWVPKAVERFGPNNVVICSLTRTAAAEIATRDLPIPRDNVGTLHALAFRSLGRPKIAETVLDQWNEREPSLKLTSNRPSVDEPEVRSDGSTRGDELASLAQIYRHNRIEESMWRHDVLMFHQRWRAWLEADDLMDFTGLIEESAATIPYAPGYPSVFVVDEAQDCSVLELDLVRKWAARAEYAVLAGDGDQAIYGWRGASARAFLTPDIPAENNYHLTQSYRVPRAVHALASDWIEKASYRYAVEYQPRDYDGSVDDLAGSSRNAKPIVAGACADIADGKTVMILATCGFMLRGVVAELRRQGVPFHNPFRPTHGGWNPLRGGAGRLLSYLRPDPETYPEGNRIWTWKEARAWTEVVQGRRILAHGGKAWIERLSKDEGEASKVIGIEDGRAVFGESWDAIRDAFVAKTHLEWFEDSVLVSKRKLMSYAFSVARKRGTAALRKDPNLVVGSIHSVKGAQADVVYLMPDLSPSGMREWVQPGDGRDGIIRTFYVGMTRARERLVLCRRATPYSLSLKVQ